MLQPDEQVKLTLTGAVLQILFAALQEAPMPRRVSDIAIDQLRAQVLAHDPQAFDPPAPIMMPPRINGLAPEAGDDAWRSGERSE
jgi:hypothetical protein